MTRFAKERYDQVPKLAAELVRLKVDVIVAEDSAVIPAAKNATKTIPTVMTVVGDPVALGYVESLARPGGNVTGLSIDLRPIPSVSGVAIILPTRNVDSKKLETASRRLESSRWCCTSKILTSVKNLFVTAKTQRTNGLMVLAGPQTNMHRKKIITFASQYRLPAMYPVSFYVADGGLMSYGPNRHV